MRICLTNPYAWPYVRRGTEAVMHGLAQWLRCDGNDAVILAGGPEAKRYEIDGVPFETVRAHDRRRWQHDLGPDVTFVPGMARALRRRQPDAVHAFLYQDALAARTARRPYAVSYGGIALKSSFSGHRLLWRMFQSATSGAAAVICPSEAAARHLHDAFGYRAEVIPNGLAVERFEPNAAREPGRILCAATPDDRRKRVDMLVDAFGLAASERPDATLVLAGAASVETRRDLTGRVPPAVASRITFLGQLEEAELAAEYARATVSCLASLNEAFGMVVVESLAAGTPVAGAEHGAIPEIVTPSTGRLFGPDDTAGCARALVELLDANAAGAMVPACRARANDYDWSVVGPRYVDVYRRIA